MDIVSFNPSAKDIVPKPCVSQPNIMTFFDRLFTSKNKVCKVDCTDGIQFCKSSVSNPRLELAAEQVRVLVYRECERRGRKLLFDSDSVEKIAADGLCKRRPSDVVEVNSGYAYKYKKPSSDVTTLGEMVFGSVAMSFKNGATYKIHNIPSPRRLLFTTIVPTSVRCHKPPGDRRLSECGSGSFTSETKGSGCSSDSKLYHCNNKTASAATNSATQCPGLLSPCQSSTSCNAGGLHRSPHSTSLRALSADVPDGCEERLTPLCSLVANPSNTVQPTPCSRLLPESCQLPSRCEEAILLQSCSPGPRRLSEIRSVNGSSFGSAQSIYGSYGSQCDSPSSSVSRICSGGSLSSLRRRWNHSFGTSLEMSSCEDVGDTHRRVRTKIGVAFVLCLSGPHETELQHFILNHSPALERILDRFRCQVEEAYSQFDEFVHVTHSAFLASRDAIANLVSSRQMFEPHWLCSPPVSNQTELNHMRSKTRVRKISSGKGKFVMDFVDTLRVFDVKDTNFFVSTILTAVLTHNLSWVSSVVAESVSRSEECRFVKIGESVVNPLCAQDLCGMLGYPAKSSKIVLSAAEKEKEILSSILNFLSYFIRCNKVVENSYDIDFNTVASVPQKEKDNDDNFDSGIDCEMRETVMEASMFPKENKCFDSLLKSSCPQINSPAESEIQKTGPLYPSLDKFMSFGRENMIGRGTNLTLNCEKTVPGEPKELPIGVCLNNGGLLNKVVEKKSCVGNFVARLKESDSPRDCCNSLQSACLKNENSLYPSIENLARMENIRLEDLSSSRDRTVFVDELLQNQKIIDKSPSPDEGYATLHSGSALEKEKNVIFVVGEANSVQEIGLVTKSSIFDVESEVQTKMKLRRHKRHDRSRTINIPVVLGAKLLQQRCRTLENVSKECDEILEDPSAMLLESDYPKKSVNFIEFFKELSMPCCTGQVTSLSVPTYSLFGEISSMFSPYQVLQGVTMSPEVLDREIRKDLSQTLNTMIVTSELSEAVCIVGDLRTWSVTLHSTKKSSFGPQKGVTVASSQMVADMLESFSHMYRLSIAPETCLRHLEKKLQEIYAKSKAVAELLMTTDLCSLETLTKCLDLAVNDVPLLLSVATTHTPELAEHYGITFS